MEIEKNIPVPQSTRARKWPFLDMEVGDSIYFAGEEVNGRAYRAAASTGMRHNRKYISRREDNGLRIWRKE